ncbi:MAG: hypothetical protein OXT74_19395 [Candidatus Poribacteria bacterium]|nr:hypothetical protein [Candidatus Poribacteria bacterium]
MKKRCRIVVLLLIASICCDVYAQSSFHEFTPGRSILGFNIDFLDDGEILGGTLRYAISKSASADFSVGVGLFDEQGGFTFPPAPTAGIAIGRAEKLGQTQLGYFSYIGVGASTVRGVDSQTNQVVRTALSLGPSASVGVFKPLDLSGNLIVSPFFGLSYTYLWTTAGVNYSDLDLRKTTEAGDFSGLLGIEFEFSPRFGMMMGLDFSFDESETIFFMGVNFY